MPLFYLPPRSAQLRDHTGDSTESAHRDSDLSLSWCCKCSRGAWKVMGNVGARVESIAESSWKSNAIAEKGLVLP